MRGRNLCQLYLVPVKLDDGEARVVGYAVNSGDTGDLHTLDNVTD